MVTVKLFKCASVRDKVPVHKNQSFSDSGEIVGRSSRQDLGWQTIIYNGGNENVNYNEANGVQQGT